MKLFNQTEVVENIENMKKEFAKLKEITEKEINDLQEQLAVVVKNNNFFLIEKDYPKGFVTFSQDVWWQRNGGWMNGRELKYLRFDNVLGRVSEIKLEPLKSSEVPESTAQYGQNIVDAIIREENGTIKIIVPVKFNDKSYKAVYLVSEYEQKAMRIK